jgi:hypothetical protein
MDKGSISRIIQEEAANVGVSPELFQRVVFLGENPTDKDFIPPKKVSPVGARGVSQVMPKVWDNFVKQGKLPAGSDPFDVRTNLRAGALVLKEGLDLNKGNEAAAVAHYNGGTRAGRLVADGKPAPAEETRKYLERTGMTSSAGPTNVSTRSTTKVDPFGPGNMAGQLEEYLQANRGLVERFSAAVSGQADLSEKFADASINAGAAKAREIKASGEIEAQNNEYKNSVADLFNAGQNPVDNQVIAAHKRRTEAWAAKAQLAAKIKEESQVSFLDDPLRWVASQFTTPSLIEAHNAVNAEGNQASLQIATLHRDAAAQQAIAPAMVSGLLRERAAAAAAEAEYTALEKAMAARGQSRQIIAQGLLQQMAANGHELQAREAVTRMFMQSESMNADSKIDAKLKPSIDNINFKRVALGQKPMTVEEFKMMDSKRRSYLTENGLLNTYGTDPGDSFTYLTREGGWTKLAETAPHILKLYNDQRSSNEYKQEEAALRAADPNGFSRLDTAEQAAAVFTKVASNQFQAASRSDKGTNTLSDGNPYKLELKNVLLMPELANNPFTKVLAEKLGADRSATLQDKDISLALIGMAQASPEKIPALAKQFSELYQIGITKQLDKTGALAVGYPKLQAYRLAGTEADSASAKPVNAFSPAEIENWLMKTLVAKSKTTFGQNGFGLFN